MQFATALEGGFRCTASSDLDLSMEDTSVSRRFVVGYALAPKKKHSFVRPSLVGLASDRGVDLVPIDPSRRVSEQGPFDCVIHKFYGDEWKSQLADFSAKNPGIPIVDRPIDIERLHNRITMLQFVSELEIPQGRETFGIPNQVVIYDSSALSNTTDLRFPIIAKPLVADGSAKSHKMSLVYHREALLKLKPPLVLQEFVNHGGVIFKVYVVGNYVQCVRRKSLPDVSPEKLDHPVGSVTFSQVSNVTTQRPEEVEYYERLEEAEVPPPHFLEKVAMGLRQAMGLRLFNFDMIRDSKSSNHYLIVDINYFPGYAKMPSYEKVLTDFLCDLVRDEKGQAPTSSSAPSPASSNLCKHHEHE
ncbi:hypothetical protein ZIOFF_062940 [Zingiber officinale]|uniref:Inositol-tetrakisphosphate 1-kinase n=2 Tax=Zingiber officinale TaxID=94328 RepID=A0A8J5KFS3_ZINOF|nr:hypothetical protein ZIOFF_062940 [Zingiber officinale]